MAHGNAAALEGACARAYSAGLGMVLDPAERYAEVEIVLYKDINGT